MDGVLGYFRTLAGKLILTVGVLLFGGSLTFGYFYFNYQEKVMLVYISDHARTSADLAGRGIRYGMLTANKKLIQLSIDTLSQTEDLKRIRIFSTSGVIAHSSNPAEIGTSAEQGSTVFDFLSGRPAEALKDSSKKGILEYYTPIQNEPACFTAECHFHKRQDSVLGVLQTDFSTNIIENARRRMFFGTIALGAVFVLCNSLFLFLILYKFVSRPVAILEQGMKRLARGDFDEPIEIHTKDEMGLLASTFNTMTSDIKHYKDRLENWALELQSEVEKKTIEIKRAQEKMMDAEKLASLGRLSAGVAHELNNPLTGIITFAHLLKERTAPDRKQDTEDLDVIIEQAEKCSKIISGLLGFARKGTTERMSMNINDIVTNSIAMLQHQSKFTSVEFKSMLDKSLPQATVDPGQIQQVIINLLTNASDAVNDKGEITIETRVSSEHAGFVEMEVKDKGHGIPQEFMGKIFEPFFTTKPVGKGTGLGLPVSYGIIKRHGGDIMAKSIPGIGTSFTVRLPITKTQ